MANYDGEFEVRLFYSCVVGGVTLTHRHTFDVQIDTTPDVGADFDSIYVTRKDGTSDNALSICIDEYMELLKDIYKTDTNFSRAELWQYGGASLNANYIGTMSLGIAGDATNPTAPAQQATITFRTVAGYVLRLQYMESVLASDVRDPYPFSNVATKAIADYVISSQGFIKGRDNTFPVVPINASYGTNEKLWRKRYRSS